jgi:(p)ppGpp synthase/HD superfamily hydrolase
MPNKDDSHAFESLSDLLGPTDNVHAWRPDRFEKVTPSTETEHHPASSPGFDLEAFDRSRTLVLPAKREKPLCLIQVRDFALEIHTGQLNRYTKEPNWKHLAEVAGLVSTCSTNTPRAIALAWLHHTVADTAITLRDIERRFGASIADGVRCLTGSSNPLLTASVRKERDRKRLAEGDADVHTVRLADMAVDLVSIAHHDPQRARSGYLEEKRLDMGVLSQGDEGLKKLVRDLWAEALRRVSST